MLRDSETNDRIPLTYPGKTLIGRAKGCKVIPSSTSISKKHAQIEVVVDSATDTMKEIWIEDLGSRNGTFTGTPENWKIINEKRRRIKVGDFIKFGLSVTYYRLERLHDEFADRERESTSVLREDDTDTAPQTQSLAVTQHTQPPPGVYDDSALTNPPSFQEEHQLLYSNIDDEQRHSPAQSHYQQRPPLGRDSQEGGRNNNPSPSMDNKIHVSIEYPEGLKNHKPPVSILIGGDEEGGGRAGLQQQHQQQGDSSALDLAWSGDHSHITNATQTGT